MSGNRNFRIDTAFRKDNALRTSGRLTTYIFLERKKIQIEIWLLSKVLHLVVYSFKLRVFQQCVVKAIRGARLPNFSSQMAQTTMTPSE